MRRIDTRAINTASASEFFDERSSVMRCAALLSLAIGGSGALLAQPTTLPLVTRGAPPRRLTACVATHSDWDASFVKLAAYKERWGTADATLADEEGRWVRVQRRLHVEGKLAAARASQLEALGVSWESPSERAVVTEEEAPSLVEEADWEDMCGRLVAYVATHGDAQVPKKHKPDPLLGGWVAAVRRAHEKLGAERVAQLDGLGFEWVSTKKCGSQFMLGFAQLRAFHAVHGHVDLARASGAAGADEAALAELGRWGGAQRAARAKGLLSPKRVEYLDGVGFSWD